MKLKYVDDTVLVADTEGKHQELLNRERKP